MKTLKELRAERATKAARGRALLDEYNKLNARTDRDEVADKRLETVGGELTTLETDVSALDAEIAPLEASDRRAGLFRTAGAAARVDVGQGSPERTGGFRHIAEFGVAVRNASYGGVDDRLKAAPIEANAPATYQQNQGTSGEGFLVPPDFSKTVWDMALDNTDLLAMADPEPTASNAVGKPKDETTPWGSAGVQAFWAAEAGLYTPSKLALSGDMMTLHKLFAFVACTDEILADAPMLRSRLTTQSGRAIGWKASDAVMWGNGAGQPTGFMNSTALVTVAKDAGQPTATVSVSNLANMLAHVLRIGGKPFWIVNQDIIPQLVQLVVGTNAAFIPINQGLQDSPFDGYIWGYPVKFTEHAQTLGTLGDISCVNMDGYYAATKQGGIDFAESMHLYFDQGLTAFRWTFRLAGQPILSKPVQPARGATAKSHFVTLAARP